MLKSLIAPIRGHRPPNDPQQPNLCKICRAIDSKAYLIHDNERYRSEEGDQAIDLGYLDKLIQRSSSCPLCALLLDCAKRINDGKTPPVKHEGKRVRVSMHRNFLCKIFDGPAVHRAVLEFEPAFFGYFSQARLQISTPSEEVPGFGRFLRVIDIEKNCVIAAPPHCRYLSLSYVWGDRKEMKSRLWLSTAKNRDAFEKEGGLDVQSLPKTISSAIELVSMMGERYLWIDALCIVQDDDVELAEQTAQMDLVYARALLTIIVAAGTNADGGLPGLKIGTRSALQGSVKIDDKYSLTQTVAQGNATHLQNSSWDGRGWTFQERLLSRRVLIFTPEQVFWNSLDCHDEWDDKIEKFSRRSLGIYVTQYSKRDFTYHSDALAAFSGILRRMEYANKETYHWGLPHTRFDHALCWANGQEPQEALCRLVADDGSVYHAPFPSWSWLGWTGFIGGPRYNEYVHALTLDGRSKSELQFYKLGAGGRVQVIEDPTPGSQLPTGFPPRHLERKTDSPQDFPLRSKWKGKTEIEESAMPHTRSIPIDTTSKGLRGGLSVDIKGRDIELSSSDRQVREYFEQKIGEDNVPHDKPSPRILLDFIVVSRHAEIAGLESAQLNLLVVLWNEKEEGVSRRIGMAVIEEKDWVAAEREWKLVVLE
ncbi:uncharacterized protein PAC_02748 [Phialocephala subalpina]|uniref:Heterokaryon incompatibility domain-containing protein n=1 Tax=Phialocephala subalpina TaxID=576137 RepID=A0A1L7WJC6_9HELO|nr:uncharacterized protein PAC_02748 [Phialocephala subalpina]